MKLTRPLTLGSLFAGIGGLELGLERAGMDLRWQVEINDYARKVLEKHWPTVDRSVHDVRTAGRANLAPVDVICGGFPCQDISIAGKGGGLKGSRSGLWFEFDRLIGELGPSFVVVENVSALSLFGGWMSFSDVFPIAGMMRSGNIYQHPLSVHRTAAEGSSLLPTPTASDWKGSSRARYRGAPTSRVGRTSAALRTSIDDPTCLHPSFGEEIMGFPIGWTDLSASVTQSSLRSRNTLGER